MRQITNLAKDQLLAMDLMNTVNGGMSMSSMNFTKTKKGYTVDLVAPGINSESMKVEVKDNKLYIYFIFYLNVANKLEGNAGTPYFFRIVPIPGDVDIRKISANYENNHLQITLPFNELTSGYQQDIDIENS